jgi:hypothetical protein
MIDDVSKHDMMQALLSMMAEFDKFSRWYGSPMAKEANEAVKRARDVIARAQFVNYSGGEGGK